MSGFPVDDTADGVTVIVNVPCGVTTGGGVCATGLETLPAPPQPAPLKTSRQAQHANRADNRRELEPRSRSVLAAAMSTRNNMTTMAGMGRKRQSGSSDGGVISMGSIPAPVVLTATVKAVGLPFDTGTLAGTEHVAAVGAPLHASATLPEKPAPGVSCKLYCAVCPAVTAAVVEPPGAGPMVTAALAVPFSVIVCGELEASSVRLTVAERAPVASGAKESVRTQLAFAA